MHTSHASCVVHRASESCSFIFFLGIVAHLCYRLQALYNTWMDSATGECSPFSLSLANPTYFFTRRFAGTTLPIANFLLEDIFCILDDSADDSQRILAPASLASGSMICPASRGRNGTPYVSQSNTWTSASQPLGIGMGSPFSSLQSYYTSNTSLLSYFITNSTSTQSPSLQICRSLTPSSRYTRTRLTRMPCPAPCASTAGRSIIEHSFTLLALVLI
jgi:hypothetical protein